MNVTNKINFLNLKRINSRYSEEIEHEVNNVINSGYYILGEQCKLFEREFASYCGADYCITVGNGLDALALSLQALDVGLGDEVFVPAFTFVATWLAVNKVGAKPIPIDVDCNGLINLTDISGHVSQKSRAVIPVHLFGQVVDLESKIQHLQNSNLSIVEDSAQAHGAVDSENEKYRLAGKCAGFSFYPGKNLGGMGDGGAIITNDQVLADKLQMLRNYGSQIKYQHKFLGTNSRLDEIQAAILRVKLRHLDNDNLRRKQIANFYEERIVHNQIIRLRTSNINKNSNHLFVVNVSNRDSFLRHMDSNGVECLVHYPIPPFLQECYAEQYSNCKINMPNSVMMAESVVSLPIGPDMTDNEVERVCNAAINFQG